MNSSEQLLTKRKKRRRTQYVFEKIRLTDFQQKYMKKKNKQCQEITQNIVDDGNKND